VTTIREFEPRDGDGLRALWTAHGFRLIGDDDAGLARFASRNPGLFVVAEDASGIVGSVLGGWDGRRGWLYHVAVAPTHQRQGLGGALVGLVEGRLRDLGCPRVLVMVRPPTRRRSGSGRRSATNGVTPRSWGSRSRRNPHSHSSG
jgi:ribosomal protein S18 acetylase RimI-like enzyme